MITKSTHFFFLNTKLFLRMYGDLNFRAHLKENQLLKYLNLESCYHIKYFKSIPNRVLKMLSKLTYASNTTLSSRLYAIPWLRKKLKIVKLTLSVLPNMKEVMHEIKEKNMGKEEANKILSSILFFVGYPCRQPKIQQKCNQAGILQMNQFYIFSHMAVIL